MYINDGLDSLNTQAKKKYYLSLLAWFTFSSIFQTPLGEVAYKRFNSLLMQRRSKVLRRVRLISAMTASKQ